MTTETILIENEAQWLAERAKDVTSTQVAALFGVSPYLTEFELWHQKSNGIVEAFEENNRTRWGNRLEETIAKGFAEEFPENAQKLATDAGTAVKGLADDAAAKAKDLFDGDEKPSA